MIRGQAERIRTDEMRYAHILFLPYITAFSIEDVQPPVWNSPATWTRSSPVVEGTCNSAVDVMSFHREKMQEYMCRQFLAEEILEAEEGLQHRSDIKQDRALPPLIGDTGSTGYKDWLARSTTLQDIYKHYEQSTEEDAPIPQQTLPSGHFDGEVTGYAMLGERGADTSGYGVGSSYGAPSYGGGHVEVVSKASSDKGMKLNDLFQLALTAIAFLAFGTFAIEIIMCIMDVKTHEDDHLRIMMMVPTNVPANLQAMNFKTDPSSPDYLQEKIDNVEQMSQELPLEPKEGTVFISYPPNNETVEERNFVKLSSPQQKTKANVSWRFTKGDSSRGRRKRSASNIRMEYLEQLAVRATATFNGMESLTRDNGRQLQRSLCEANLYSRSLEGAQKIWLPLWSFGISWISGRQLAQITDSPFGTMKFLTATIQGMAGVNCEQAIQ